MTEKITTGHCPDCRSERKATVMAGHKHEWSDEDHGIWGIDEYFVLQCRGCDRIYFQHEAQFSEDIDYSEHPVTGEQIMRIPVRKSNFPTVAVRLEPDWVLDIQKKDPVLFRLLQDLYGTINNGLWIPAAIAIRTAFDRCSEHLGVDSSLAFKAKLDQLQGLGILSQTEKDIMDVLIDAGGAAAHRGWRPKPADVEKMTTMLESFVHRVYVLEPAAKSIGAKIPPKKKKA